MTEGPAPRDDGSGSRKAAPADEDFDAPVRGVPAAEEGGAFLVRLDGYEGPLDVLLDLARRQKVDLRQISILALVDQYLSFMAEAKARDLELAADYLVMASWLTFLKSKLLLPAPDAAGDEPSADELSARLAFQLQRLDAMRKAAEDLTALPQLGHDVFARPVDGRRTETDTTYTAALYDLLKAYARQRVRAVTPAAMQARQPVWSLEEARTRLERIVGKLPDWCLLVSIGGDDAEPADIPRRSVLASNFAAALEGAKAGKLELRQSGAFAPLYVRSQGEDVQGSPDDDAE